MTSRKADACTLPALLMPMHWNMPESKLMRPRIFRLWLWAKGGSKSPTPLDNLTSTYPFVICI